MNGNGQGPDWLMVGLGAIGGYLLWDFLRKRQAVGAWEQHAYRGVQSNRYKTPAVAKSCPPIPSFPRKPRSAGARECVFGGPGKTGKCKWPVGTKYHQKKAFSYLEAGRVKKDQIVPILEWLENNGDHAAIRCRARAELAAWEDNRSGLVRRSKLAKTRGYKERWGLD